MDAQRIADITAALSDAVGRPMDYSYSYCYWYVAGEPDGWKINRAGDVTVGNWIQFGAASIDRLHAASQIVRRMNHA